MREELKPCPFCGGKPFVANKSGVDNLGKIYNKYIVICDICTAEIGIHDSKEQAINTWNTRPGADNELETAILLERQAKRIKELEAENAKMRNLIAINTHFRAERKSKYGELLQAVWAHCDRCDGRARGLCQTCSLVQWRPPAEMRPGIRELRAVQVGDWEEAKE
jgi:Lar family restriction alleviation protein